MNVISQICTLTLTSHVPVTQLLVELVDLDPQVFNGISSQEDNVSSRSHQFVLGRLLV